MQVDDLDKSGSRVQLLDLVVGELRHTFKLLLMVGSSSSSLSSRLPEEEAADEEPRFGSDFTWDFTAAELSEAPPYGHYTRPGHPPGASSL